MVELDRSAIDGLAARVLESGMAPVVALAVSDRERTLVARSYYRSFTGSQAASTM